MTNQAITPDQLDAAILETLSTAEGETMAWAELRERLPNPGYWPRVQALTRLVDSGQVMTWKDDLGRNYVSLALAVTVPLRQPRPVVA